MNGLDVLNIIEQNPDWNEYGVDEITDLEYRGDLVLWMAQKHGYIDELCAEVIPRPEEAEFILEIFNPNREERLYKMLREWFWNYVKESLDEEMEKVWQRNNEDIKYDGF